MKVVRISAPSVVDDHEILDPDAAEPGMVDAGLDRDDVAGGELVVDSGRSRGSSWTSRPTPVAEPVAELLAEARRLDHVARDRVDLARRSRPAAQPRARRAAREARRRRRWASSSGSSPVANVRVQSEQ